MNLDLFINIAEPAGFTVDTAESNVFHAHKDNVSIHVDGNVYYGLTMIDDTKLFRFYSSETVQEFGLKQLQDAIQILS